MDQEFRDDGTVICPVHGLRYDPNLTSGCIRCPRSPTQPPKKAAAPKRAPSVAPSTAPAKGSVAPRVGLASEPPPSRPSRPGQFEPARIGGRITTPPIPFEPGQAANVPGVNDPNLKIVKAPPVKYRRRGLFVGIGALLLGGAGAAWWFLRPEAQVSWAKKVKPLKWDSSLGPRTGSLYACTRSQTEPRPLLVVLDPNQISADSVVRYARIAERHGWSVASIDSAGRGASPNDGPEVDALIEYVRGTVSCDATKVMIAGYDVAGEAAYRLAILQPDVYGGAIAECCGSGTWRDVGAFAREGTPIFLFTRTSDSARDRMMTMKDEMEHRGLRVTLDEMPGSHEPMTVEDLEPAFVWLDSIHG